jgi:hypothetical protein
VAGQLARRLDELTELLAERIAGEIDIYRGTLVDPAELRRSVRHNLTYLVDQLSTMNEPDLSAPRLTGQRRALQQVPLPEVLRAYRLGFAFLWEQLLAEARADGEAAVRVLTDTATEIWSAADDYSQALTESYRDALAQRMLTADRHRSALVEALVTGRVADHGTMWELAKLLELPYEGTFVAVVAENAELGSEPLTGVESRLQPFDIASAWRLQPEYEVGVISCGRRPVAKVIGVLAAVAAARVGVSPTYSTLDRTPRAVRLAQIAMRNLPDGQPGVAQFDDTPLGSLVAADATTTREVVHRVLGGLLELDAGDRATLLSTVEAWLDGHGSAPAAGRALYVHQNTVRYRLRRVEELTGRSLDDPRAVAELATALQALRIFPGLDADPPKPAPT